MRLVFPALDGLNEADVREEIITPVLHELGYRSGTRANIIREQSLRYPRACLGRKDLSRDPPLRGRADYILEVDNRVRWTIEAKPPTSPISPEDVDQAYSYAYHPEVRAVLFCLMSGSELRIYQTNAGPNTAPILSVSYSELPAAMQRLANVLGPDAIVRDYPEVRPDVGEPIGPGLRSVVRVSSGIAEFHTCSPAIPLLAEMSVFFDDGAIERDDREFLIMYLHGRSPFRSVNVLNERLGLGRIELVSPDRVLSVSERSPTEFRLEMTVVLPAGESVPNLLGEGELTVLHNIKVKSTTLGRGVLRGKQFVGDFSQAYEYSDLPKLGETLSITLSGRFQIALA